MADNAAVAAEETLAVGAASETGAGRFIAAGIEAAAEAGLGAPPWDDEEADPNVPEELANCSSN
jgi:hypothetical protein